MRHYYVGHRLTVEVAILTVFVAGQGPFDPLFDAFQSVFRLVLFHTAG